MPRSEPNAKTIGGRRGTLWLLKQWSKKIFVSRKTAGASKTPIELSDPRQFAQTQSTSIPIPDTASTNSFNIKTQWQGPCRQCHHHHHSKPINIHVTRRGSIDQDVYCERCSKLLFSLGGAQRRLSLLSVNTLIDDWPQNVAFDNTSNTESRGGRSQSRKSKSSMISLVPSLSRVKNMRDNITKRKRRLENSKLLSVYPSSMASSSLPPSEQGHGDFSYMGQWVMSQNKTGQCNESPSSPWGPNRCRYSISHVSNISLEMCSDRVSFVSRTSWDIRRDPSDPVLLRQEPSTIASLEALGEAKSNGTGLSFDIRKILSLKRSREDILGPVSAPAQGNVGSEVLEVIGKPFLDHNPDEAVQSPQAEPARVGSQSLIPSNANVSSDIVSSSKFNQRPFGSGSNNSRASDGDFSLWTSSISTGVRSLSSEVAELEPYRATLIQQLLRKFLTCRRLPNTLAAAQGDEYQNECRDEFDRDKQADKPSSDPTQKSLSVLKRSVTGDGFDDDDNRRPVRRRIDVDPGEQGLEKLLACPFSKNNPLRYSQCYKYTLPKIHRLKQHLMRRHRAPPHCDRCWEVFETEELRFTHNRTVECQILPPKQLEGITDVQKQHLVQRVSARNTREENWYLIYEYLFPNSPRPTSPYRDPPLSEDMIALRDFYLREGPETINNFIDARLPDRLRLVENDVRTLTLSLLLDTVTLLLERWALRAQNRSEQRSTSEHLSLSSTRADSGFIGSAHSEPPIPYEGPSSAAIQSSLPASEFSPRLFEDLEDLDLNSFASIAVVRDAEDAFESNWLLDEGVSNDDY